VTPPLTRTERQVALLVAWGATNRQVEDLLQLDPTAVERHLAEISQKLGVLSRAELGLMTAVGAHVMSRPRRREP
jgi:DNA-binding NarL/FixJ family response regulator